MTDATKTLLKEILQLSLSEREELIDELFNSLNYMSDDQVDDLLDDGDEDLQLDAYEPDELGDIYTNVVSKRIFH